MSKPWPPTSAGVPFDCCEPPLLGSCSCPYAMGRYACHEWCGCKERPNRNDAVDARVSEALSNATLPGGTNG